MIRLMVNQAMMVDTLVVRDDHVLKLLVEVVARGGGCRNVTVLNLSSGLSVTDNDIDTLATILTTTTNAIANQGSFHRLEKLMVKFKVKSLSLLSLFHR